MASFCFHTRISTTTILGMEQTQTFLYKNKKETFLKKFDPDITSINLIFFLLERVGWIRV